MNVPQPHVRTVDSVKMRSTITSVTVPQDTQGYIVKQVSAL